MARGVKGTGIYSRAKYDGQHKGLLACVWAVFMFIYLVFLLLWMTA